MELYGLKPNGQPINSNPYSKHSDGDGLEDNEELHFSRATMTYELDKSQYDGSVFVWSDPCLNDTDWDGYDDKKERELGSNPIVANFYIENEDFEYITGNNYFTSNDYLNTYSNSKFESSMIWLGNNVFSSNGDKVSLYKKAIIDYLDVNLNSKKTEYDYQELYDLEKSIYEQFNKYINSAYQVIDVFGKQDDSLQKDIELLDEFKKSIQRRYEILNETYDHKAETRQSFFKRIDEAAEEYEWYVSQTKTLDKKIKLKNMGIKTSKGIMKYAGFTLDIFDMSFDSAAVYNDYVIFKSNVRIMEDSINMLETFSKSENVYVKKAALELLDIAKNQFDNALYGWDQVALELVDDVSYAYAVSKLSKLPKYGSYASFFIFATGILSNASELSINAEYTVANATIANSLCEEICEMAKSGEQLKNGISISTNYRTVAKRFTDLIVLRRNAEEQYIKLNQSLPFYLEWAEKDCLEHAENNINTLNVILSKYSYVKN